MPALPTIDDVTQRVADLLNLSKGGLGEKMTTIVADSYASAVSEVTEAFKARGFSDAQFQGWDRRREYVIDIALFWAMTKAGSLANYSDLMLKKLDRRAEIATMAVTVNGVIVQPDAGQTIAGPVVGRLNERGYRFSMSDSF